MSEEHTLIVPCGDTAAIAAAEENGDYFIVHHACENPIRHAMEAEREFSDKVDRALRIDAEGTW